MEATLFQNMSPKERLQMLEDNSDGSEIQDRMRELTEEEINDYQKELGKKMIALNKVKDEKKKKVDEFKAKMKPIENEINSVLKVIKVQSIEVEEEVWKIKSFEDKMVGFYNRDGMLVSSRRMFPDENQVSMFDDVAKVG